MGIPNIRYTWNFVSRSATLLVIFLGEEHEIVSRGQTLRDRTDRNIPRVHMKRKSVRKGGFEDRKSLSLPSCDKNAFVRCKEVFDASSARPNARNGTSPRRGTHSYKSARLLLCFSTIIDTMLQPDKTVIKQKQTTQ